MYGVQPVLRQVPSAPAQAHALRRLRQARIAHAKRELDMQPLRCPIAAATETQVQLVGQDVRYPMHVQHDEKLIGRDAPMPLAT